MDEVDGFKVRQANMNMLTVRDGRDSISSFVHTHLSK